MLNHLKTTLKNMPIDWLELTTHRLDIYHEDLAKSEFTAAFESLIETGDLTPENLQNLPTAYDYIRLGHPLSCVLEWAIAQINQIHYQSVIGFASKIAPVLAILRHNLIEGTKTRILYSGDLPPYFDIKKLNEVYRYSFDVHEVKKLSDLEYYEGTTVYLSTHQEISKTELNPIIDFYVNIYPQLGSILVVNGPKNAKVISEVQHVRRRETVAMTPADCFTALNLLISGDQLAPMSADGTNSKESVLDSIIEITKAKTEPIVGSSGLSIQYAIMMGLIDDAMQTWPGKPIRFVVPPNCYGGTNDQARRVAACIDGVEVVDLPVDGENDMVVSIDRVLDSIAKEDAVPYIIAEIPTNPRVEVPDLAGLKAVLKTVRTTKNGQDAVPPVFILDQTFCPNVRFLVEGSVLDSVKAISYVSGSKFPSGGKCTAGYCVGNGLAASLMEKVEAHIKLCDNEATDLQLDVLAAQLPSMNQRIADAYENTRHFVTYIKEVLPSAKINFVSPELAKSGFTPSVFSLDLPAKGNNLQEREANKRQLNQKLIKMMITEIPHEAKNCVSYGQLKGSYWTVPATSTQGTTKEGDKDYIVRASLSAKMDLALHKQVFSDFANSIK